MQNNQHPETPFRLYGHMSEEGRVVDGLLIERQEAVKLYNEIIAGDFQPDQQLRSELFAGLMAQKDPIRIGRVLVPEVVSLYGYLAFSKNDSKAQQHTEILMLNCAMYRIFPKN